MKRKLPKLLIITMLLIVFFAFSAGASDLIELDYAVSSKGEGWSYDADTLTLTLDGYELTAEEDDYLELSFSNFPKGFTIHLAEDSVNRIPHFGVTGAEEDDFVTVTGPGELILDGNVYGNLHIKSGSVKGSGGYQAGRLYGKLIVDGGTVTLPGTKASGLVQVNGGTVEIEELDTYKLVMNGGVLNAAEIHNCNGADISELQYEINAGKLNISSESEWSFIVVVNSENTDIDIANDVLTLMNGFGKLTAPDGSDVDVQVKNIDNENLIYEVGFVGTDGQTAYKFTAQKENPFLDISADSFYHDPVLWACSKGITKGTDESGTAFSPLRQCTRGEIVTFLWRANGEPEPETLECPFDDVHEDDYYYKAVLWAAEKGITTGTGENTFSPNVICSRSQIVTFLWRAEGKPQVTVKCDFADVQNSKDFYYDAVQWAVENGITSGTGNGNFSPLMACDRSQTVTFLYRTYR